MMRYQLKPIPSGHCVFGFCVSALLILGIEAVGHHLKEYDIATMAMAARLLICGIFAFGYALQRVRKHPGMPSKYSTWLQTTPWRWGQQLPLGPAKFCLVDLIVLAVLTGTAYIGLPQYAILVPLTFFLTYSLSTVPIFLNAKGSEWALAVIFFALPLAVYPFFNLYATLAFSIVLFTITHLAAMQVLRNFPWNMPNWTNDEAANRKRQCLSFCGWPFSVLLPRPEENQTEPPELSVPLAGLIPRFLVIVWIAWVELAITRTLQHFNPNDFIYSFAISYVIILLVASVLAAIRLLVYVSKVKPPISLFGRLATGNFIIPRYDKVFIAPLATIFAAAIVPPLLYAVGIPLPWMCDLSVIVVLTTLLGLPPSFEEWEFTAQGGLPKPSITVNSRPKTTEALNVPLKIKL